MGRHPDPRIHSWRRMAGIVLVASASAGLLAGPAGGQDAAAGQRLVQLLTKARALELGTEPQLTSITEYGLEKNGLRFPSQDTTEEAYLKDGRKLVKSLTIIAYKDYKFFTAETEIRY